MPIPGLSDIFNRRSKSGGRWINFVSKCMDCGKVKSVIQVWRDDPNAEDEESHGLCLACEAKRMAELDRLEEDKKWT